MPGTYPGEESGAVHLGHPLTGEDDGHSRGVGPGLLEHGLRGDRRVHDDDPIGHAVAAGELSLEERSTAGIVGDGDEQWASVVGSRRLRGHARPDRALPRRHGPNRGAAKVVTAGRMNVTASIVLSAPWHCRATSPTGSWPRRH